MSNKNKKNPFYFFLKEIQSREMANDRRLNIKDQALVKIADNEWRFMDANARKKYVDLAEKDKQERLERKQQEALAELEQYEAEDNSSLGNIRKELQSMESIIDKRSIDTFKFTVGSSNVFFRNNDYCFPAEVGFVHFSFLNGIVDQYHSFIHHHEFPAEQLPNIKAESENTHRIPFDDHELLNGPQTERAIAEIHQFLHTSHGDTMAYVFCESDEYLQMIQTIEWLQAMSQAIGYPLIWNVKIMKLSTLYVYISEQVLHNVPNNVTLPESYETFKLTLFTYHGACPFHERIESKNCALSTAHNYCYILAFNFCNAFGIERLTGKHKP